MIDYISENGVLTDILFDKEDTELAIPEDINEIKHFKPHERNYYHNSHNFSVFIPDSVVRYGKRCFNEVKITHLDLPYRKTLELGVTIYTWLDYLTLRLEDGTNLKFDFSNIAMHPFCNALLLYRTEEMRLSCSPEVKGPLALYFAHRDDNQEAFEFVKKNASKIGRKCIDLDDIEGMERLLELGAASKVPTDTMLKHAREKEKEEFVVMLMQYKHSKFSERGNDDRFRL